MQRINLLLADNVPGSDPVDHLYKAVNVAYPALKLTRANSKIIKIQAFITGDLPTNTCLEIQSLSTSKQIHTFYYNRFNITQFVVNPVFDTTVTVGSSAELVQLLGTKLGLNLLPKDFWTSDTAIDYCGGEETPNWYMEACYDSVYWSGRYVVWLHPYTAGPEPEPKGDWILLDVDTPGSFRYGGSLFSYGTDIYSFFGMGITYDGEPCDSYKYDTRTKEWTILPIPPAHYRYSAVCGVAGNKAYFIGGSYFRSTNTPDLQDVWCYDISSGVWSQLPDYTTDACSGMGSVVVGNKLYVMGGARSPAFNYGEPNSAVMRCLDTATNTWTELADMPDAYSAGYAFTLSDPDYIYYTSGMKHIDDYAPMITAYEDLDKVFKYRISTNTWSLHDTLPFKLSGTINVMLNHRLYLYHGGMINDDEPTIIDRLYSYDGQVFEEVITEGPEPMAAAAGAMTVVGSTMYIAGGIKEDYTLAKDFWKYTPENKPITPMEPIGDWILIDANVPSAMRQQHNMFTHGTDMYCVFGTNQNQEDLGLWKYSTVNKVWSELPRPPDDIGSLRIGAAGSVVGDKAYFIGGLGTRPVPGEDYRESVILNDTLVWNIGTTEWSKVQDFPESLLGVGSVAIGAYIYTVGGASDPSSWHTSLDSSKTHRLDTRTNTWSALADLPETLGRGVAFTLGDPDVFYYTFGMGRIDGWWQDQTPLLASAHKVYMYRVSTNTWSRAADCPTPLLMSGSTVVKGRLYVYAGLNTTNTLNETFYSFDGVTWSEVVTVGPEPECYAGEMMTTLGNALYVTGGAANIIVDGVSTVSESKQFWKFIPKDPPPVVSYAWSLVDANSPALGRILFTMFSYGPELFLFNGHIHNTDIIPKFWKYHTVTKVWTELVSPVGWRYQPGIAVVGNKAYIIGGGEGGGLPPSKEVWCYTIDTGVWKQLPDYPIGVSKTTCVTADKKIYCFGGDTFDSYPAGSTVWPSTQRVRCLDTVTDIWTELNDMPIELALGYAFILNDPDIIYYAGGRKNEFIDQTAPTTDRLYQYRISTDTWTLDDPLPIALGMGANAIKGGKFYVWGGVAGAGISEALYSFDGSTWEVLPDLDVKPVSYANQMVAIGDVLYVYSGLNPYTGISPPELWKYDKK